MGDMTDLAIAVLREYERFSLDVFLTWLQGIGEEHVPRCDFATAPDVVGDWDATWERSRDVLPLLRSLGYPAAIVLQDGAADLQWDAFDAVFVGGTTAWKESTAAGALCASARQRGKWVHMGRVNSMRRLCIAQEFGCDSVDGTFLAFGPKANMPRLIRWMQQIERQPSLFGRIT